MKMIVCLDQKNGVMFNNRRQSRDIKVIEKMLDIVEGDPLLMTKYSAGLFGEAKPRNCYALRDPLDSADEDTFVLVEDNIDIVNNNETIQNQIELLIVFRWDKVYPSDKKLEIDFGNLISSSEFKGNSHDKITMEVYRRCYLEHVGE